MTDIIEIDTTGLFSPAPVLKARQQLETMAEGARIVLKATDSSAAYDVPNFCERYGHTLASKKQIGKLHIFEIIRGPIED